MKFQKSLIQFCFITNMHIDAWYNRTETTNNLIFFEMDIKYHFIAYPECKILI